MSDLTDSQANLILACYDLDPAATSFVFGALVRAAVDGVTVTPERLRALVDEALAVTS